MLYSIIIVDCLIVLLITFPEFLIAMPFLHQMVEALISKRNIASHFVLGLYTCLKDEKIWNLSSSPLWLVCITYLTCYSLFFGYCQKQRPESLPNNWNILRTQVNNVEPIQMRLFGTLAFLLIQQLHSYFIGLMYKARRYLFVSQCMQGMPP